MKLIWQCMFSPRLYKKYYEVPMTACYEPYTIEKWTDKIIRMFHTLFNIGIYTSPIISVYIFRRGFIFEETSSMGYFFVTISSILLISFILRGYSRASNPIYVEFLKTIKGPTTDKTAYLQAIRKYDFDFSAWPVTYSVPKKISSSWLDVTPLNACANPDLPKYKRVIVQVLAFIATHTFGLCLIYPGSVGLVHNFLWSLLMHGRTQLVEKNGGQRTKIETADGNTIDTMFGDKRGLSPKGDILLIACEGNMGFYEFGILNAPLRVGYSALGWNHPGFAWSTGRPYPAQEQNAVDAVIQYAINELKFAPENIIMYGWSIGGYSCAWAASHYPVKGVYVDATFDDLLPLAEKQMPPSWSRLVREVVRSYVNLNVAELLTKYDGPIILIRRTKDEIICLTEGDLSSNRGNHLVAKLISHRHPRDAGSFEHLLDLVSLKEAQRPTAAPNSTLLPLISKYMRDYKATHCAPLNEDMFEAVMAELLAQKPLKDKEHLQ